MAELWKSDSDEVEKLFNDIIRFTKGNDLEIVISTLMNLLILILFLL